MTDWVHNAELIDTPCKSDEDSDKADWWFSIFDDVSGYYPLEVFVDVDNDHFGSRMKVYVSIAHRKPVIIPWLIGFPGLAKYKILPLWVEYLKEKYEESAPSYHAST